MKNSLLDGQKNITDVIVGLGSMLELRLQPAYLLLGACTIGAFQSRGVLNTHNWGTYRGDHTSPLSHLSTLSSHLTVSIGKNLLLSFFSFTFEPKILQSFISSQLTTWFCHDSQKTSLPIITWGIENCTLLKRS